MKRPWWVPLIALALVAFAGAAHAASIGAGVFGGMSFPVLQDDQAQGSMYGVRLPVKLAPMIAVEPFYADTELGDKTIEPVPGFSTTREGSKVDTYGVNAILATGGPLSFYPFAGIGSAHFTRQGQDETFTSYHVGVGVGISPVPKLVLDLRGELQAAAA